MTRKEMLNKMGLTEAELKDLLQKYMSFFRSLDANQQAVVARSLPNFASAAKTFGPDVTAQDVQGLFGSDDSAGVFGAEGLGSTPNPNPNPNS